MNFIKNNWKNWQFKNTYIFTLSLVFLALLAQTSILSTFINFIGSLGYFGIFLTGIFFVSTFTVVPASVVLFNLAEIANPVFLALIAGAGAMIGDFIVFKFIKDKVFEEWKLFSKRFSLPRTKKLIRSPYFAWTLPVIGAFMIASPFPDEVGLGLLGCTKIKRWQFFLITFLLNTVGIFIVVSAARLVSLV